MVGERLGRLYHRGRARWTDARVHESLRFRAGRHHFRARFVHHHNPTLVHRAAEDPAVLGTEGARLAGTRSARAAVDAPFVFIAAFFKDYVLRLGFLDGGRGYVVSQVAASYAVYKRLRYYEMKRNPASRELARNLLAEGQDP